VSEPLAPSNFICEPDPDHPGWRSWILADTSRFNQAVLGHIIVREEGPDIARVRMFPKHHHTNSAGIVHGAVTLGFTDIALFAAMFVLRGVNATGSATVDLTTQFIGAGDPARPLDALVEVLRETRRLGFLRGLVVQDDDKVSSFTGTIRKPTAPR